MAKKRKASKKAAGAICPICAGAMQLRSVIPPAHIFPELRTFQCQGCGHLRTVEDEADLKVPVLLQRAA